MTHGDGRQAGPTRPGPTSRLAGLRARLGVAVVCALSMPAAGASAQEPAALRPAFSLSSSTIFTTRDAPAIYLTYRRLERLDFRVYRVRDPVALLAGLENPHQLGSEAPLVDQEPTAIERIARWKADWRGRVRGFFRAQFSRDYRRARRQRLDAEVVVRRRIDRVNRFAQVPLLNPSQLVTSWREFLPPLADVDVRRIPIEVHEPGMYVVEAVSAPYRAYTIVIVSDVGLLSKAAPGQVLLYATDRFSGAPVPGCDVRVLADQRPVATGTTGADGVFLAALDGPADADAVVSVATCDGQVAASDPGSWYLRSEARELVGYVYTDKPIYRPGHTIHVKAFLRFRERGGLVPFHAPEVELRVSDVTDKVIFRARRPVDRFGGVTADVPLPAGAALGTYSIAVVHEDDTASGLVEVQEYRKPEFEVRVQPADRFVVQGQAARLTVNARYYFGQPVAHGRLTYVVRRQPYHSPLRWSDDGEAGGSWWWGGDQVLQATATLDPQGRADITIPTEIDAEGGDQTLRVEARVTDASGREVGGHGLVQATYGPFLVAVSTEQYVARPGTTVNIRIRAVTYDGAPVAARPVDLELQRRRPGKTWQDQDGAEVVQRGAISTDAEGRGTWPVTLPASPGDYRVRAAALADGRALADLAYLWVPGGTTRTGGDYGGDRYLELIADKRTYAPGETARFLIRGAEFDSDVLVTKEAQHVSWYEVLRARGNGTIEVPIGDEDLGDTWVNIAFLRDDRVYRAERRVRVPPATKQLHVTLTADQNISRPREPGRFTLRAVDAGGQPVRAQFSLAVIDEAVYGVKADSTPDPLHFFHQRTYSRVGTTFSREYSFVGYSGTGLLMLTQRKRALGLADFKGEPPARPEVRREFPDSAYWIGDLVTDQNGEARVTVTYPDALTTWRVTARGATEDSRVGAAIARTTVTKDLIVRVIAPRFLTEDDEVVVPVIAHSYDTAERPVAVTLTATGLTPRSGPRGGPADATARITLAPGGEQRLDWRYTASETGTATLTGAATAPPDRDAVERSLPVLPFGLAREVGRAGSIAGAGERRVSLAIPATANPAARTIRLSLSPSLAGSLLGALDFLTGYPYGCTEQTLSAFLPTLSVSRTMQQLKIEPTERLRLVDRQVTAGIARLLDYQDDEGGWGWWRGDAAHPFMTAYAVYGLLEAHAAGFPVDEWRIRRGVNAIGRLYREYPRAVPALKAYLLYVLSRAETAGMQPYVGGQVFDRAGEIEALWGRRSDLTAYGRALLLLTLDAGADADPRGDALAAALLEEARRTGELAWWEAERDPLLDDWGDATVDATAAALQALAPRHPDNPVLESAVRYLMVNRLSGSAWASTKQTAMALYGLTTYMKAKGEQPASFSADVIVNGGTPHSVRFGPADLNAPDPVTIDVAGREGDNDVVVRKRGDGALYWAASARYFDTRSPIERTGTRKLAIAREYFMLAPVQQQDRTVYRETRFGGQAAPGDVLLVRLTVAGADDWRYLLIEDPLPAGAEPIGDEEAYPLERRRRRTWGTRRELRDDRVVFFQDRLPDGRVEFWYLLKVVTPGEFRAMPARVMPMYVPGVWASTTVERVSVEPPGEAP